MSSSASEKPRIHPSFPTPVESAANPELAYSDHLPILATVPLSENTGLSVISLNILGGVHMSGVHHPNSRETDEGITARYTRMADGLKKAINLHDVDVVMLQEADSRPDAEKEPYILPILRAIFGDEWEVMLPVDDRTFSRGLVTCYRKTRWALVSQDLDSKNRIHTIHLKQEASDKVVSVSNIWGNFEHSPVSLERQCKNALNPTRRHADISVIIGDTNSRIAPLDGEVRNIVTGAIPLAINEENGVPQGVQTPDHPDGGFYRDADGKIHQLQTSILCYSSGEVLEDKRSLGEVSPSLEQRMVMCLDDSFKTQKIFGERTLFEYEDYLKEQFNNRDLIVRLSTNAFNQKGVGIRFPLRLAKTLEFIKIQLADSNHYLVKRLCEKNGANVPYLFVTIDNLPLLLEAIELCIKNNHATAMQEAASLSPTLEHSASVESSVSNTEAKSPWRNWKRNAALGFALSVVVIGLFTLLGFVSSGVFPFALAPLAISFLGIATGTGLAGGIGIFTALAVVASVLAGVTSALIGGLRNKFSAKTGESLAASLGADETTPFLPSKQSQDEPSKTPIAPVHTSALFSDEKPPARPDHESTEPSFGMKND